MELIGRNVNHLYALGLEYLDRCGAVESSRAGAVIVAPGPVVSVYENPTERVLFDARRDANPFFHLMESLWMLAGRDDAAFLNNYVKDFGARFAEPDAGYIHGAYGHRWRHALGFDQLDAVVEKLRANPQDRQAVIQMWDAAQGEQCGPPGSAAEHCDDLRGSWRDRPCNTHVYLRVRDEVLKDDPPYGPGPSSRRVLDMTVCCRSNDVVWGAYGANAVHFSVLQEYLAGRIGVGVGRMYQFSNNWHGYVQTLDKVGEPPVTEDPYDAGEVYSVAMATDWSAWDADLRLFMNWHDAFWQAEVGSVNYPFFRNKWFGDVAVPAVLAYWSHKQHEEGIALHNAQSIAAPDWSRACTEWLRRRYDR